VHAHQEKRDLEIHIDFLPIPKKKIGNYGNMYPGNFLVTTTNLLEGFEIVHLLFILFSNVQFLFVLFHCAT